eukprot:GFYU01032388.1.p1 GENE.GFYU01032388.1~~GFYU01032388.1.p1  ORF type:complete len:362 (-),score=51.14 GFYU01032388.1:53-1138(-)
MHRVACPGVVRAASTTRRACSSRCSITAHVTERWSGGHRCRDRVSARLYGSTSAANTSTRRVTIELATPKDNPEAKAAFHQKLILYRNLYANGLIDGVVVPDFGGMKGFVDSLEVIPEIDIPMTVTIVTRTRDAASFSSRMAQIAEATKEEDRTFEGVLLVGGDKRKAGDHADSLTVPEALTLAQSLELPGNPSVQLAVVNGRFYDPRVDTDVDTALLQKVKCGATRIVTQPPLNWDKFGTWWSHTGAHAAGGRVVVGIAFPTSTASFRRWLKLSGESEDANQEVLAQFEEADALGEAAVASHSDQWTMELVSRVCNMSVPATTTHSHGDGCMQKPDVHLMPLDPLPVSTIWKALEQLQEE